MGQFAIQLAHLSGYKVVTVASPRNFALVKSLGADAVFDYRDPDVLNQIKHATGDSIKLAFDTIAEKNTQELSVRTISPSGGKVVTVLLPEQDAKVRDNVEIIRMHFRTLLPALWLC